MGVVITSREHAGMTPLGMSFSDMASMTGGGVQTPGFMGHGKQFIFSKKFIAAEGGPGRIVWMPKELKDQVRERLDATALELYGVENFTDMVADETVCTEDPEQLLEFLGEVGHPVLSMEPFDR
jgi:acetyl-CoA synthase